MKINKALAEKIGAALLIFGVFSGSAALLLPQSQLSATNSASENTELPSDDSESDASEDELIKKLDRDLPAFSVFFLTSAGVLLALAAVPDRKAKNFAAVEQSALNKGVRLAISQTSSTDVDISFTADFCTDAAIAMILDKSAQSNIPSVKIEEEVVREEAAQKLEREEVVSSKGQESLEGRSDPGALEAGSQPIANPQQEVKPVEFESLDQEGQAND